MVPRNMFTGAIPTNVDKLYVPWTVADDDGKKRFNRTHENSAICSEGCHFLPTNVKLGKWSTECKIMQNL